MNICVFGGMWDWDVNKYEYIIQICTEKPLQTDVNSI